MSNERIPVSREGYDKKKAQLDHMKNVQMIEITKRVATAREMGDLSENAEYHAAREDQGMQQAKIRNTEDELARAYIVDPNSLPKDTVVFGARVKVRDLDMDEDETFELVGPGSEDRGGCAGGLPGVQAHVQVGRIGLGPVDDHVLRWFICAPGGSAGGGES